MGKHAERPTLTQNVKAALEAVRTARTARSTESRRGAHSAAEVTLKAETSRRAQMLEALRHRPVLTAVTVPAAASILLASGGLAVLPQLGGDQQVVTAAEDLDRDGEEISRSSERAAEDTVAPEVEEALEKAREQSEDAPEVSATQKVPETTSTSDSGSSPESSSSSSRSVSGEPCSVSSDIESGLTPNAIKAYRAVCAEFPEVKSYGGRRNDPGSDHNSGQAVDVMITGSTGDRISQFLIDNASSLNIKYIIWEQRIWMPGSGWKGMSDRDSATANHFDHVHISVN